MYVVSKIDFHYNDEVYYAEGEGVIPVTVYRTRESAQKAADELTLEQIAEWDLLSFGYAAREIFKDPDTALDLYQEVGYKGDDFDDLLGGYSEQYVKKMNVDQRKKLVKTLKIKFVTVNQVEVEETA